jgi:hypothetical protein
MCVEAIVGRADQLPVELAPVVLRRSDQHDRFSLRIEGIGDAPLDLVDGWPKLLLFGCFDPFSVSAQGRPSSGPSCSSSFA